MDHSSNEERIAELRQQKGQITAMLASPAFVLYSNALTGMVRARRQAAFTRPLDKMDAVFANAADMNQAAGIELALVIPTILLNDIEQDLLELVKEHNEQPLDA